MTHDLWFSDFECFAHDWLFVAKRQRDGETISCWNDPETVQDFVELMTPVLVGFNYRDYDSWLLKGILLGWSPEEIKHINDTIIHESDRSMTWNLFQGCWVDLPPIIDLIPDIVPRMGLKNIEANIGMSIVESSVPFDIDRRLTADERDEVLRYCVHDVEATEALYALRFDYLTAKTNLCELKGIDPLTMLKHSNARIVSEVMEAVRTTPSFETYAIPENIDITTIPDDVVNYVMMLNTDNCTDKSYPSLEFLFHGCPTVVGLGGIHAAVPSYMEHATDARAILMQDIGSYYPSLIINNGYMSRAVPDVRVYERFYDTRMAAKAMGDKATADAAKLVLNTTYGTMKDTYNKMFDPMQATRVCLSGQLYIIDLIETMYRAAGDGLTLVQLNTDGWVVSCPREALRTVQQAVEAWQARTGLVVETDEVAIIVQANVNNYALRFADGKNKAKGGVVAKWAGGDFKSNSATIIDAAVLSFLLDDVPIADTIDACSDIERFQIVAKAGRTFSKVVHQQFYPDNESAANPIEVETQRCNRVYATTDIWMGGIFKVKMEDGKETGRSRIPLTPEHCFVDNENLWQKNGDLALTTLDKSWYAALATEKAKAFITRDKKEKDQMSEVTESTNELKDKPKPTRKAKDTVVEAPAIPLFAEKLQTLNAMMLTGSTGVSFDKVVSVGGGSSVEYADTQQYKSWFAQACQKVGLVAKLDLTTRFLGVVTPEGKTPSYGAQADGWIALRDVNDFDSVETYSVSGFAANVQPGFCSGAAQTNALRNFLLNNFMLDNKGREGDDQAFSAATDGGAKNGYVAPAAKAEMKQGIAADKAEAASFATDMFAKALYDNIIAAQAIDPKFCVKMVAEHFEKDGTPKLRADGKSTLDKVKAVNALNKAEEIIATVPKPEAE